MGYKQRQRALLPLHCEGIQTKVTCPILDLVKELDVVIEHEGYKEHQAIISYKDEQVTLTYKPPPQVLCFDVADAQPHPPQSSLCSI